jgi:hypothetical protein
MADHDINILIRAKDLASKQIGAVSGKLGKLDGVGSKAARNLTTNFTRIGVAAGIGLAGGVVLGARSLGHLERVTNQTKAVLESTGAASGQTADSIRAQAEALEKLTTADDKAIQEGQNMLLTFTKVGGETFPRATEAATNMAIAMASGDVANADFVASSKQIGKALQDPIRGLTALRKSGVSFTKEQEQQIKTLVKSGRVTEAQALILDELETEFGQAGKAAGTGFEADMRRLEDAGEDATQALARGVMPALSRFATFISTKLADPAVIATLDEIGETLGDAAEGAIDFLERVDFKAIGGGLKIASDAARTIVDAFLSLPPWVQTAVVTGWGLNKLTGGALGDVVGALGSGLIKGVLGMNAGVVNINAGVVNGGGGPGIPGGGSDSAGNRLGGLNLLRDLGKVFIPAAILSEGLIISGQSISEFAAENNRLAKAGLNEAEIEAVKFYRSTAQEQQLAFKRLGRMPSKADYDSGVAKLEGAIKSGGAGGAPGAFRPGAGPGGAPGAFRPSSSTPGRVTDPGVLAATTGMKTAVVTAVQNARSIASRENSAQRAELQTIRGLTLAQTAANAANSIGEVFATARAALASTNAGQAAATATANSASRIVAAIYAARPVIQSTTVQKTTTINNRYGETGGSRQSDWSPTH